jgi:hypothetical protein
MSALKDLVIQSTQLEELLIESNGELTPDLEEMLVVKDVQIPAKVDAYADVMLRMEMLADYYKQKADVFLRMSTAASAVIDRCKDNLKGAMLQLNEPEIRGFDIRFKLVASNPSVVIQNESQIPLEYIKQEIVEKIDKKKIAENLKAGKAVSGAVLEQSFSLRKYANTPSKDKK